MYLNAITTALEARDDLRVLLSAAEKTKENLLNSDLAGTVFMRTYQMIENIVRDATIAIENINIEFDRLYRFDTGVNNG